MRLSRTGIIPALALFSATLGWAQAEYFPLQVGNTWTYRYSGRTAPDVTPTIAVVGTREVEGRTYFEVRYPFLGVPDAPDALLRVNNEGTLVLRRDDGREAPWVAFAAPVGSTFRTEQDPCSQTGRVDSRSATVRLPIGEFTNGLQIAYPSANCADAGLSSETYLPGIGLACRESITIAGPLTLELVHARVGERTLTLPNEVAFSLALDRAVYILDRMPGPDAPKPAPVLNARLTLRNMGEEAIRLTFSSGQEYDLLIRNERGEAVYRWSADRSFIQIVQEKTLRKGELTWLVSAPLARADNPLPPGKYTAEAFLATTGETAYRASVGFEIVEVQ